MSSLYLSYLLILCLLVASVCGLSVGSSMKFRSQYHAENARAVAIRDQYTNMHLTSTRRRQGCLHPLFMTAQFKGFDDMLSKIDCPVLVDFYAEWCGPCKMMVPVLETLAGRLDNEIKVAKVDTDKSPRLGSKYAIEALPTLILFNKGEVVERFVGYRSADELEREVRQVLKRINTV